MTIGIVSAAYISAAVLFILSLGGLSGQESAKRAVWYGIVGMALAVVPTIFGSQVAGGGVGNWFIILLMIAGGSVLGTYVATRVQMTEMPQLVAALHSFVGLAAVFIGFNAHIEAANIAGMDEAARSALSGFAGILAHKTPVELAIMKVEVFLGVFIGAVTFTGSVVAFGKLAGKVDGKAKKLPGGHFLNAAAAILSLLLLLIEIGLGVLEVALQAAFLGLDVARELGLGVLAHGVGALAELVLEDFHFLTLGLDAVLRRFVLRRQVTAHLLAFLGRRHRFLEIDDGDLGAALTVNRAGAKQHERNNARHVKTLTFHWKTSIGR